MLKLEIYTTEQKVANYFHDQAWTIIMRKYSTLPNAERREKFRAEFPHHPIDYRHPHKSPSMTYPDHPSDRRRINTSRADGFDNVVKELVGEDAPSIDELFAPLRLDQTQGWLNETHLWKLAAIREEAKELSDRMHTAANNRVHLSETEIESVALSDIIIEFIDEAIALIERDGHICMEKY